eukprot:685626-Pleurochrysis_carterae.AAC.1
MDLVSRTGGYIPSSTSTLVGGERACGGRVEGQVGSERQGDGAAGGRAMRRRRRRLARLCWRSAPSFAAAQSASAARPARRA